MIKHKTGLCPDCNDAKEVPLIAGKCSSHYWKSRAKIKGKSSKKHYAIAPVSKKRLEALKKYRRIRDKFLAENPKCMYPGCNSGKVTLHHGKGRIGSFLTDKRFFKALCWPHHDYIERHPAEAKKLGLSYERNDKFL